jgi:hypothetical protein
LAAAPVAGQQLQHGLGADAVVVASAGELTRVSRASGRAVTLEADSSFLAHDLAVVGGHWLVAGSRRGLDRRERIALLAGDGERQRELPAPPGQTGGVRTLPVVFGGERLLAGEAGGGLAWLEGSGPSAFAVWAAEWTGDGFAAPEVVSPAGRGTQTGLAGVELADGTWLLVWSAFDGSDDEIVWSLRAADGWSPPRRVAADDGSPDITPTVVATGDGALLAWSRWDGAQYRLALASFRGGGWSEPSLVETEIGLYPEFVRGAAAPMLSYLEAAPRRWTIAEVDAVERRLVARAAVASTAAERPWVVAADAGGVRLRWVDGSGAIAERAMFRAWAREQR